MIEKRNQRRAMGVREEGVIEKARKRKEEKGKEEVEKGERERKEESMKDRENERNRTDFPFCFPPALTFKCPT
jgi:hypothetical protein